MRYAFLATILACVVALATVSADNTKPILVPKKVELPAKNFTQDLVEGIKFEMVYVPGGEYVMGSPDSEAGRGNDEGPQHKVALKPFWIAKWEVSWDEYDSFWKNESLAQPSKDPPFNTVADALTRPTNPYVPEDYKHGREGFPAICMSHHAAMMYCHWLRVVTKRGYRLPTEAEWEYACRAGSPDAFSFGNDASRIGDFAQFKDNSPDEDHAKGTTAKCGSKKPNAYGIHDMHGNVSEWVIDHYDAGFYSKCATKPLSLQPVVKLTDKKWSHVVRGGSFKDPATLCRSAARRSSDAKWMYKDPQSPRSIWWLTNMDQIGFRIVLPVEEQFDLLDLKPMVVKKAEHDPIVDEDK